MTCQEKYNMIIKGVCGSNMVEHIFIIFIYRIGKYKKYNSVAQVLTCDI